jgi:hypothetical protein
MISQESALESHPLDKVVAEAIRTGAPGALFVEPQVQVEMNGGHFQIRKVGPKLATPGN